ncbi:MAG: fatty acid desaturase [SAR324 cluster bacterium]|nr:fatty acid desaturase [SAR324 cluster bacterium]
MTFFDFIVGLYSAGLTQLLETNTTNNEAKTDEEIGNSLRAFIKKNSKRGLKNYVFYPALAGPFAFKVFAGNLTANIIRNLWASSVIFNGHFPEDTTVYTEDEIKGETRGDWYLRQVLGSANFDAGIILHTLSGHLSLQVEHHLFPRIPAWRYREMAPKVRAICEKYGVPYNTDRFSVQFLNGIATRIFKHALPEKKLVSNQAGKSIEKKVA